MAIWISSHKARGLRAVRAVHTLKAFRALVAAAIRSGAPWTRRPPGLPHASPNAGNIQVDVEKIPGVAPLTKYGRLPVA